MSVIALLQAILTNLQTIGVPLLAVAICIGAGIAAYEGHWRMVYTAIAAGVIFFAAVWIVSLMGGGGA